MPDTPVASRYPSGTRMQMRPQQIPATNCHSLSLRITALTAAPSRFDQLTVGHIGPFDPVGSQCPAGRALGWPATASPCLFINWYTAVTGLPRQRPVDHEHPQHLPGPSARTASCTKHWPPAETSAWLCDLSGLTVGGAERYTPTRWDRPIEQCGHKWLPAKADCPGG